MSLGSILIIAGIVWVIIIICTVLVLAVLMRSSQLSQMEEESSVMPETESKKTRTEMKPVPVSIRF
jgi:hypothetical protein